MRSTASAMVACVVLGSGASLAACAPKGPQLRVLYGWAGKVQPRNPVVLIHGILGSLLRDRRTGREVWPGGFWRLLLHDFRELALPSARKLEASGVFTGAAGADFYRRLFKTLVGYGGYRLETGAAGRRNLYPFFYDWRKDNAANAARLDTFIEAIRREHGDPELRMDVVAHSMGGLLARYYVRYGRRDVLDLPDAPVAYAGGKKIRRLILVAPPNAGSLVALRALIMGDRLGLRLIPPEVVASWPAFAQLLPQRGTWPLVDNWGRPLDVDLYDIATWKRHRWSVFDPVVRGRIRRRHRAGGARRLQALAQRLARNLERARQFHRALTRPAGPGPIRPVVFGGDCMPTPVRYVVERVGERIHLRTRPEDIVVRNSSVDYQRLMFEPGDGRVTKASALARTSLNLSVGDPADFFTIAYSVFLCADHGEFPSDMTFRNNLLNILLSA